jgi:hypothetical protein
MNEIKNKENPILWTVKKVKLQDIKKFENTTMEERRIIVQEIAKNIRKILTDVCGFLSDENCYNSDVGKKNKQTLVRMLENGWYPFSRLPLDFYKINELDDEEFNKEIYEFYKKFSNEMTKNILEGFKQRYEILNEAIEAYNKGMFWVSIPTFLTQIDGISREIIGTSIFNKIDDKTPLTKQKRKPILVKEKYNYSDLIYLTNLDFISEINKKYKKGMVCFNRHGVIHGFDTDYGNEINNLKCMVILNYLAELKNHCLIK